MRDKRFIARHRGGPLEKNDHRQLIKWAVACVRHILPLYGKKIDLRILKALDVAKKWESGRASVGDARQAAFGVMALARGLRNQTQIAIARAAGHAVATAHMADHAPGAAEYALKAVASVGQSIEAERNWQDKKLPPEIKELVISARKKKEKAWQSSRRNMLKVMEKINLQNNLWTK
jgi:hypothetical protein